MNAEKARDVAARLLGGVRPADLQLEPLNGGANNQVFRVRAGGRTVVLKAYFQHADDRRDRLGSEYRFAAFAWAHSVRQVPQPLSVDWDERVALYEDISGQSIGPGAVTQDAVDQAAAFFHAVNAHRDVAEARALPTASEAYFSLSEHLRGVEARVRRLDSFDATHAVDREAAAFVARELTDTWDRVAGEARTAADRDGILLDDELPDGARRLSPSDFGFHNAIAEPSGRLRFVDFEYAGWDDPAKLVCDFFCQEAVPVPSRFFGAFAGNVVRDLPSPQWHLARIDLLLPVYRVKWCCIMLNDFLPMASARRHFTDRGDEEIARKTRQLKKAREALLHVAPA